jgi:chitodextrinase
MRLACRLRVRPKADALALPLAVGDTGVRSGLSASATPGGTREGKRPALRVSLVKARTVADRSRTHIGKGILMLGRWFSPLLTTVAALAAFVVVVPNAVAADRKAPTAPKNIRVISNADTSIEIAWNGSTDNVGVAGYGLYRNGALVATTTSTNDRFSGLACATSYKLGVDAYDAAGNRSRVVSVIASTVGCSSSTSTTSSAPANMSLPTISGVAQERELQTASEGTWSGSPTSYAYQWLRCDSLGEGCGAIAGATGKTYTLVSADVARTVRAQVTASNEAGSSSTTSVQTAVVAAVPSSSVSYPSSYFTGPLGTRNILPPKNPGVLLGLWPDGTAGSDSSFFPEQSHVVNRETFVGRKFDLVAVHYAAPSGACHYGTAGWTVDYPYRSGQERWIVDRGAIPVVNWTHGWTIDEVNQGMADACIRSVARDAAAFGSPHLLRIYHEFNGGYNRWSGSGETFISAWRRTVDLFRAEGATNVGFVWSVDQGHRSAGFASYPGDNYVDWVGVSAYNMNLEGAWCSPHDPGPWCTSLAYSISHDPVNYPSFYDVYSGRKPFGLFEWGSVEDPNVAGRKAKWFDDIRVEFPVKLPRVRAAVYFDVDTRPHGELFDWRLSTSASSMNAFKTLALDPHYHTRY